MKKVAATRGQSVSFAMDFFVDGITREGNWAGSDIELNLYSRPPQRNSLAALRENEFAGAEYKSRLRMQEKNGLGQKFLQLSRRTLILLDSGLCARRLPAP